MIKHFLINLLFLTVYLTSASAQELINQFDDKGERHGYWKKNYDNTDFIRYEGHFDHSKETGIFKFYKIDHGKSVLSATREFHPDNDLISVKFFSSKGKLISEGQMRDKLFIGKWLYYHNKTKAVMTEEHYNDQGKLEGLRSVYYPSGQLAEQANYDNGQLNGITKIYSNKGVVIKELEYKDGVLNGMSKYYDGAGQLLAEGVYKSDKKHGIWKYYENGVLTEEKDFTVYSKNPIKQ